MYGSTLIIHCSWMEILFGEELLYLIKDPRLLLLPLQTIFSILGGFKTVQRRPPFLIEGTSRAFSSQRFGSKPHQHRQKLRIPHCHLFKTRICFLTGSRRNYHISNLYAEKCPVMGQDTEIFCTSFCSFHLQ